MLKNALKQLLNVLFTLVLVACNTRTVSPNPGEWHVILEVQDNKQLPFQLIWNNDNTLTFVNAEERIQVTDVQLKGDSITIAHPVFEGVFKGVYSEEVIKGDFIKPSLDRVVPFVMVHGKKDRFDMAERPTTDVTGSWEMIFSAHSEKDRYIAKGIFQQTTHHIVTGTIRTTTGDYRYLEGVMDGNTLKLSTFDGAHAFLFEAEVKDSLLFGFFYSGNHWKEPFSGVRNETYELPDENSLTYLKDGYDRFDFSFPDSEGKMISLSDDRFQNKVVVIQIMGTWCPNCLEESRYYVDYLKEHPSTELELVSLAFEYTKTEEMAWKGIEKFRKAVNAPYPILLAQYGTSSKEKANDKLPMLNHVLSYPTTLFVDKKGTVRKIHTGFNGKATGKKYEQFVAEFETFLEVLLSE